VSWPSIITGIAFGLLVAALVWTFWRPSAVVAILLGGACVCFGLVGAERVLTWRESHPRRRPPDPPDTGIA
jgi:predicted lysophospholipase L1 biosynthesis ABC-type transport system permease subunit